MNLYQVGNCTIEHCAHCVQIPGIWDLKLISFTYLVNLATSNTEVHKTLKGHAGVTPSRTARRTCHFVSIYLLQFCQLCPKTASKHIIYATQHRLQRLIWQKTILKHI